MIRTLLVLLHLRSTVARLHHGLPHKVLNVTQTPVLVAAPVTVNYTTAESCLALTSTIPTYSILYPSPNASPVEITAQSQVVTSYIPEMTWCVGPPIALIPMTGPPYLNATTEYSTTIAGTGSCETMYSPLETVCSTELNIGISIDFTSRLSARRLLLDWVQRFRSQPVIKRSRFRQNAASLWRKRHLSQPADHSSHLAHL